MKNISSFKYFSDCLVSGKLLVLLNQTNQALEFFWFSVVNEKGDVIRLGGNVMSRWLVPLPLHRPSLPFLHLSIPLAGLSCFGFCPWPHICQPRHLSTEVTDNHSPNTHIRTLTHTQTLRYLIYIYMYLINSNFAAHDGGTCTLAPSCSGHHQNKNWALAVKK